MRPTVLGAAADDLYEMQDFERAITSGQWLIDQLSAARSEPSAAPAWTHRRAFVVRARAITRRPSMPTPQVLAVMEPEDRSRQALVDNLAASIYKQGEQANGGRTIARRPTTSCASSTPRPTSKIRASAEYDAGAALIHLQDWNRSGRSARRFPHHVSRSRAATATRRKQLADRLSRRRAICRDRPREYERVAVDASDPEMRRQALLVAGDLYEQSAASDEALRVYLQYVDAVPAARSMRRWTSRFKIADMYKARNDQLAYQQQLRRSSKSTRKAGAERTDRSRTLAANSALVLSSRLFDDFKSLTLRPAVRTEPHREAAAHGRRARGVRADS